MIKSSRTIPFMLIGASAFLIVGCGATDSPDSPEVSEPQTVVSEPQEEIAERDDSGVSKGNENARVICLENDENAPGSVALRQKEIVDGEPRFREIKEKLLYHGDTVEILEPLTQDFIAGTDEVILVKAAFGQPKDENDDNVTLGFVQRKYLIEAESCPKKVGG